MSLVNATHGVIEKGSLANQLHPAVKVIFTKKKGMKAAWFIALSRADLGTPKVLQLYKKIDKS